MTRRSKVRFAPSARDDLKSLSLYLSAKASREIAENFLDEIERKIDALSNFPARGSIPRELQPLGTRDYRQIVVGKIRIIYEVDGDLVSILVVADGRRDMQTLLRQRLLMPN